MADAADQAQARLPCAITAGPGKVLLFGKLLPFGKPLPWNTPDY
jgi:hypothetical protein